MYKIIKENTYNVLLYSSILICAILAIPLSFFGIPIGIYNVITTIKDDYKKIFYGILISFTFALPMYYYIAFMTLFEFVGFKLYDLLLKE